MNEIKCVNLEYGLRIENDGTVKSCCMQQLFKSSKLNVLTDKFEKISSSETLEEIREAFKRGEKHSACRLCWEEEDSGKDSKRIRDNRKWTNVSDLKFGAFLDINMGTTCNIKCRTCGPFNSSQWNDEWYAAGYFRGSTADYKTFLLKQNHAFDDDSQFWEEFENNLENIRHIDFYGGEPFLVKKQWKALEYAIEKGYSQNISLHYNTNGTIWDDRKTEILSQFKKVDIDFSIDGISDHLNYIRYPADWKTVFSHFSEVLKLSKENDKFMVSVCLTVSTLNVYYIDKIMEFFTQHTNNLYLNLVHGPDLYCIKNIPDDIKHIIIEKLNQNYNSSWAGSGTYNGTLEFMKSSKCDMKEWTKFLKSTSWHDNYRNQNFKETFPEFYKVIEDHGYKI